MRTTRSRVLIGAVATAALLTSGSAVASATGGSVLGSVAAVGLTSDQKLIRFDVRIPGLSHGSAKVTGLSGDAKLVGINYRVQNGKLYGVGSSGRVYTLDPKTGNATKVSQPTVALAGTSFGADFNPAADRLRVISNTGQNLRHDVNAGGATIVDGTLTNPPATTAAAGVTGAAYTNNDLDATTATTLFDLDTTLDQIAIQAPANAGQLSATGKLGVDATGDVGFDIYSDLKGGKTATVTGYATLSRGSARSTC